MSPRTLTLIPIVVAATILGLTTLLLLRGSGDDGGNAPSAVADPLVAALAYVPSDAPLVAVAETDAQTGPFAQLTALAGRVPAGTLALGQAGEALGGLDLQSELLPVLGNPLVLAVTELPDGEGDTTGAGPLPFRVPALDALSERVRFATVATDSAGLRDLLDRQVSSGALQRDGESRGFDVYARADGGGYALKGPVLVGAGSRTDLASALALAARSGTQSGTDEVDDVRSGSLRPGTLRDRFRGLPGRSRAALRASIDLEVLQRTDGSQGDVPWVSALRRASFAVAADDEGLSIPFRLETDPEIVTDGDVPIATGPRAPQPAAADDAPVVLSFRDIAHTLEFARRTLRVTDPDTASQLDSIETNLRRFARVDPTSQILAKLTGTTTITLTPDGPRTLRAELTDPESVSNALGQLQRISTLSSLAGGIGVDVDTRGITVEGEGDGRYRVQRDGEDVARVAVINDALVIADDPSVDLQSVADAFPESPPQGTTGAFFGRISADAVGEALSEQLGLPAAASAALGPLGEVTVRARGATNAVTGAIRIALAP